MRGNIKGQKALALATAMLFASGLAFGGAGNASATSADYNSYMSADRALTDAMKGVNSSVEAKSTADSQTAQAAQQAQQEQQDAANNQQGSGNAGVGSSGGQRSYSGYGALQGRGSSSYTAPQQYYQAPSAPVQQPAPAPAPTPAPAPAPSKHCIHLTYPDGSYTDQCNYW